MRRSMQEMVGYVLIGKDGEIGRCKDFLIDEEHWGVRYMVADTGRWLPGRKVLVSPMFVGEANWGNEEIPVALTREELVKAPPLEEHAPISRRYEKSLFTHFGLPYYWVGGGVWGLYAVPPMEAARNVPPPPPETRSMEVETQEELEKEYLRSMNELLGYTIEASDGEIGSADDMILETETWAVHDLIVDTGNWLPGKKVMVHPSAVDGIWRVDRAIRLSRTHQQIEDGPEYDPHAPVNAERAVRLYDYEGRPHGWL